MHIYLHIYIYYYLYILIYTFSKSKNVSAILKGTKIILLIFAVFKGTLMQI